MKDSSMNQGLEKLTREESFFANVMFQNRILDANGQRYEDLFVAVMTRRVPGFRPIKPQGNKGDEANDGYVAEEGRYYQVYSPEEPTGKETTAASKATGDFARLKEKWHAERPILEYNFAFNDKYSGAYPEVEHALNALADEHCLSAQPFLAKDLEREFMSLSPENMQAVLGAIIPDSASIEDIDHHALTGVLQHLVDNQAPLPDDGMPSVPDYETKLTFNSLKRAASLLTVGNYQNAAVENYFNRHGEYRKSDIRDRIARSYGYAKAEVDGSENLHSSVGDRIFFRLLASICPNAERHVQDAAIVLIAYFFEKCDVFEDPKS